MALIGLHDVRAFCDVQVDLQKTWVMFSSIVLAFAFVFGNSVRTVYESIIYLFVVHPFDVGDKIIVDSVSSKVRPHNIAVLFLFNCCKVKLCLQQMPNQCCNSFTSGITVASCRCVLNVVRLVPKRMQPWLCLCPCLLT